MWAVYYTDMGLIQTSGPGSPSDEDIQAMAGGSLEGRTIWRGEGDVNTAEWMDLDQTPPVPITAAEADPAKVTQAENQFDLPTARIKKQSDSWKRIDSFIKHLPSGLPRYDDNWKTAALAFDKSAMTTEQLIKYGAVFNWIDSVWSEYEQIKAQIIAASSLADVEAIELDLSSYEIGSGTMAEDPDITIAEIRPA